MSICCMSWAATIPQMTRTVNIQQDIRPTLYTEGDAGYQ